MTASNSRSLDRGGKDASAQDDESVAGGEKKQIRRVSEAESRGMTTVWGGGGARDDERRGESEG